MPAGTPAWIPLANVTLGADVSTVTFSNIVGTYKDLVLVANLGTTSFYAPIVRFNSDTGSNYFSAISETNGSAMQNSTTSNTSLSLHQSYSYATNNYANEASLIINLLEYSSTDKHKSVITRISAPYITYSASGYANMQYARWGSTSALTSISFIAMTGGNYKAGSTFCLYGVSSV